MRRRPQVPWFEARPEDYLGGVAKSVLLQVREAYPIALHATGFSLGAAGGADPEYLAAITALCRCVEPGLVSAHLSSGAADGGLSSDQLTVPYTRAALASFDANIDRVQNALGRAILIENPSVYLAYLEVDYHEGEFLAELVGRTGCGVLLDVNNVMVSASNLGDAPADRLGRTLDAVPAEAIGEIHLAGHALEVLEDGHVLRIDDHGAPICAEVWDLYTLTVGRIGARPTLIEWDVAAPAFRQLEAAASTAQAIQVCVSANREWGGAPAVAEG